MWLWLERLVCFHCWSCTWGTLWTTVCWLGSAVLSALRSTYSLCAGSLLVRERDVTLLIVKSYCQSVSGQHIFIIYLNNSETKINAVLSGTYWIYSIYPPNYVPTSTGDHCHRTLYLFAFWINNLGFLCVFILSLLCLYTILTRRHILFNRMLYVKI